MTSFSSGLQRGLFSEIRRIKGDITSINLLSYATLAGVNVCLLRREEQSEEQPMRKREFLEKLCKMSTGQLGHVREYFDRVRDALLRNGYHVKLCRIRLEDRGLVGTGSVFGKVLFEVGLSFDSILNVPYIPASSLKGAFRHVLEQLGRSEEAKLIFGSTEEMGVVGVTDAYPTSLGSSNKLLSPDVLTPHYYIGGEAVKTELDVKPTPVVFTTIAPGVEFEFYIYYNKNLRHLLGGHVLTTSKDLRDDVNIHIHDGDLAQALEGITNRAHIDLRKLLPLVDLAVIYALTRGVGAKTSIGYTKFKLLEYKTIR